MSGNSNDAASKEQWIAGLLAGWKKRLPKSMRQLTIADRAMTKGEVSELFEDTLASCTRVDRLRAELTGAIRVRNAKLDACEPIATAVESLVRGVHGVSIDALRDYGLEPPRKAVMSSLDKAIAQKRREATRQLNAPPVASPRGVVILGASPTIQELGPDGKPLPIAALEAPLSATERVTLTELPAKPKDEPRLLGESPTTTE